MRSRVHPFFLWLSFFERSIRGLNPGVHDEVCLKTLRFDVRAGLALNLPPA
jgi:hypothetical protein